MRLFRKKSAAEIRRDILKEELRQLKSQSRGRGRRGVIQTFRKTAERMASKPAGSGAYGTGMFDTSGLRNIAGKR